MERTTVDNTNAGFFTRRVSRLEFLKHLALGSGVMLAGCTPLKIIFSAYPDDFKNDKELCERILRAFATTVVPGAPVDEPNLVTMFTDQFYPFHAYCEFFVADLCSRSDTLFGEKRFERLSLAERTRVVESGLAADSTTARLYRGAIFLIQVSFYAGVYDDEKGCPLIDFHGTNRGFKNEEMYYADPVQYLADAATSSGNFA
jgi:hypothetical protein